MEHGSSDLFYGTRLPCVVLTVITVEPSIMLTAEYVNGYSPESAYANLATLRRLEANILHVR